jgi:branched-chain amino acid transport system substrate-binding protein
MIASSSDRFHASATTATVAGGARRAARGARTTARRRLGHPLLTGVALAAAAVLTLAGCGEKPSAQSNDTSKPLVIGISLPLTGDFSQPGGEAKRGYEVWREQINATGGLLGRQVQLKIVDDASSQDTVVTDYTTLITQDKVDLLLGTFSSLLNFPASAVAEKNGMVFVEPAGGAPTMFQRGFTFLFFAQPATAPHQADVFVEWIKGLPAAQRPRTAAYPTQDDPFTTPVIESMQKQLEALGVQTVYSSVYPADTTNLQTVASQLAAKKPDLIAQGAVFEDGVGLVRSLKQLDYSPKLLFQTSAPSNAGQYSDGIGPANTEGVFYTVSWNEKATTPLNKEFTAAYKAAYNNATPAEDAADAFAAAQVLAAATTAVGSVDQAKIRDWLHANEVQTILGPLSWQPTGEPNGKFLLAQWQSGVVQVVAPAEAATTTTVVNPKPDWK